MSDEREGAGVGTGPSPLDLAVLHVFRVKEGQLLSTMLTLGNRLGLLEAMGDGEWTDASALSDRLDLTERWVREWLYAIASAGLAEADTATGGGRERFRLGSEMRLVLASPDDPAYAGGMFNHLTPPENLDRLANAFRTGTGFGWGDHGAGVAEMQHAMTANRRRRFLVPSVLTAVPGLVDRLEAGIDVIDVGCGSGSASLAIAGAFANSHVVGIDPSEPALAIARAEAARSALTNVSFGPGTFDELEPDSADLLLTLDVIHDLARPADAFDAGRRALKSGALWLVADIRAGDSFAANQKIPMRAYMYSMSVMYCMNSSLSERGGAGLGTMGLHRGKLDELAAAADLRVVSAHEFDFDVSNRYYVLAAA